MKRLVLPFALGAVVVSPAFAQSADEKTGVNSVLGIAPKTEDFIKKAATGNADEKKFAGRMIPDHTKTSAELKGLSRQT